MKRFKVSITLFCAFIFSLNNYASQQWTAAEKSTAATCSNCTFLNQIEKDAIMYLNLARLYPKKFADIEVQRSAPGSNRQSLYMHLHAIRKMPPVIADLKMSASAECLGKEQEANGERGHNRENCPKNRRAECCSYGQYDGREIIMQLLIDKGVPSLGHRKICLTPYFTKVGVAHNNHPKYGKSCVIEFN